MAVPVSGEPFHDFDLGDFSLRRAREAPLTFLIVWRTECPTCRLTMPFVQRLHERYPQVPIVGIAQNQKYEVEQYAGANRLTFTNLPDDTLSFSRRTGIDLVPVYWLLDSQGKVLIDGASWDAAKLESINVEMASRTGSLHQPLITDADGVPAFKPG
jgi:thiol-disulfide isomerase/thioredoxin